MQHERGRRALKLKPFQKTNLLPAFMQLHKAFHLPDETKRKRNEEENQSCKARSCGETKTR